MELKVNNVSCGLNNDDGLTSLFFGHDNGYFTISRMKDDKDIYLEMDDQSNGKYFAPEYLKYNIKNGEVIFSTDTGPGKIKGNDPGTGLYRNVILKFGPVSPGEFKKMEKILEELFRKDEDQIDERVVKEWNLSSFKLSEEGGFLFTKELSGYDVNGGADFNLQKKNDLEKGIKLGKTVFNQIDRLDEIAKDAIQEEYPGKNTDELKLYNITFSDHKSFSLIYSCEQKSMIVLFKKDFTVEMVLMS